MYEFFEHTADIGLRVRAASLDLLFRDAARGLFAIIADPPRGSSPALRLRYELSRDRMDYLFFDWLSELLYTFDTRSLLLAAFDVRIEGLSLVATAEGRPLEAAAGRLHHEVKAITYHGLRVEPTDDGWLAEVIVDI